MDAVTPSSYQVAIWDHFARTDNVALLIEALAGSGKTTTILNGLARLPGRHVLLTSFGTDIVDELNERATGRNLRVRTLHSLGLLTLLQSIEAGGLPKPQHDRNKAFDHAEIVLREQKIKTTKVATQQLADFVGRAKNDRIGDVASLVTLAGAVDGPVDLFDDLEHMATVALEILTRNALDLSRYDFEDMIWLPLVRQIMPAAYDQVVIDEAQDTSPAQIFFSRLLARSGRITAVGDRNQSLYGFRGADKAALDRIVADVPCTRLALPISYRCPNAVIAEAQKYVPDIQAAPGAIEGSVQHIQLERLFGMAKPGDFVVSRTNAPLAIVAAEFKAGRVPIMQLGRGATSEYIGLIERSKANTIRDLRAWLDKHEKTVDRRHNGKVPLDTSDRIRTIRALSVGMESVEALKAHIRDLYSGDAPRDDAVILSTTHRAKGKERNRVFLLWDHFFLERGDKQEERNIAYVAITRTKVDLFFVHGNVYKLAEL